MFQALELMEKRTKDSKRKINENERETGERKGQRKRGKIRGLPPALPAQFPHNVDSTKDVDKRC